MESLSSLCWRLSHSTEKGYCALSLRGSRLGVRLVMVGVSQPTSSQGSRSSGRFFFTLSIARLSVTQASAACKVGFGPVCRSSKTRINPLLKNRPRKGGFTKTTGHELHESSRMKHGKRCESVKSVSCMRVGADNCSHPDLFCV